MFVVKISDVDGGLAVPIGNCFLDWASVDDVCPTIPRGEDGGRDDGKPEENDPAVGEGGDVQTFAPDLIAKAEGLKHGGKPVGEVPAEQAGGDDVEDGEEGIGEPVNHHGVDILGLSLQAELVAEVGIGRINRLDGEMEDVENDKDEEDGPGVLHRSGGEGGLVKFLPVVGLGPGPSVFDNQQNGHGDVDADGPEEEKADGVEDLPGKNLVQEVGVTVDCFGWAKNLEVTEHVTKDEASEDKPGKSHEEFFANGGRKNCGQRIHGKGNTNDLDKDTSYGFGLKLAIQMAGEWRGYKLPLACDKINLWVIDL